ncbi:hypothetical protein JQN21_15555 [Escherichia coli]|nr:hypothetical protein [Escherichia coli]
MFKTFWSGYGSRVKKSDAEYQSTGGIAQGNVLPVLYGEMRVGSRVVSQEISTADEGDGGQVVVIGR